MFQYGGWLNIKSEPDGISSISASQPLFRSKCKLLFIPSSIATSFPVPPPENISINFLGLELG